ncbi:amidohydrolase family protein [Amycolatopsis jejuensis]|uniref:amidohydrolase family protein n=1 Tax=Amycolatopsis jejuensis TaxID=330084 RepID=UPI0005259750|nr:amidohydrolase family protein [Amycolatopsis jejuensis]
MIDNDVFVINAIAHAYDFSAANIRRNRVGRALPELVYGIHRTWNPPELQVPREVFLSDQTMEMLSATQFLESQVDLAVSHHIDLDGWTFDSIVSHAKNCEAARRWPQRYLLYVGAAPFRGIDVAIKDMERQVADLPEAVGLKLYPDSVAPIRSWRMDDPEVAYPLYESARDLGLKVIAIHKALPNGPVPMNPYRVDDVDRAAYDFPDLNFEIVHAGMAFVDETAQAIARFPNVYANLETTSLLLNKAPRIFGEVLAQFLYWGGAQKIFWADGGVLGHSQSLLEKFWAFELPADLEDKYQVSLTREIKADILGRNYAAMIGLDIAAARARIETDEFSVAVRENGLQAPYSNWLREAGVA